MFKTKKSTIDEEKEDILNARIADQMLVGKKVC
jgi:hypothetical protein